MGGGNIDENEPVLFRKHPAGVGASQQKTVVGVTLDYNREFTLLKLFLGPDISTTDKHAVLKAFDPELLQRRKKRTIEIPHVERVDNGFEPGPLRRWMREVSATT